jgi:hypothetical protein
VNGREHIVEFQLWQRIRNFFDRNSQLVDNQKTQSKEQSLDRRTQRRVGKPGEIRIVPSPGGKPVKGNPNIGVIYAMINTPAQAARANRLNSKLYK